MFQKQTFGAASTGFGSFNAGASTSSPFSGFKPTASTSAFGAPPAFGANSTPQSATGGGLFGSTNTTGGLFGNTTTPSTFGQSSGFGFGANTSGGGLFSNNAGTGLFAGNQNTSSFGAKPAGFGFGSTTTTGTTGGLFGSTPSTSTGLFGQQNNTLGGTGLFGNTTGGFGQQAASGTAHVKYNPVVGTDVVVKSGTSQNVNIKHHCITCMKEYESKSLEELRLEDYAAGRKGAPGGMFGGFQQTENKPLFGGSTFGQPATTSAPSLFGGGIGSTGFGQTSQYPCQNMRKHACMPAHPCTHPCIPQCRFNSNCNIPLDTAHACMHACNMHVCACPCSVHNFVDANKCLTSGTKIHTCMFNTNQMFSNNDCNTAKNSNENVLSLVHNAILSANMSIDLAKSIFDTTIKTFDYFSNRIMYAYENMIIQMQIDTTKDAVDVCKKNFAFASNAYDVAVYRNSKGFRTLGPASFMLKNASKRLENVKICIDNANKDFQNRCLHNVPNLSVRIAFNSAKLTFVDAKKALEKAIQDLGLDKMFPFKFSIPKTGFSYFGSSNTGFKFFGTGPNFTNTAFGSSGNSFLFSDSSGVNSSGCAFSSSNTSFGSCRNPLFSYDTKTCATTPNCSKPRFGSSDTFGVKSTGSELNASKTGFGDIRKPGLYFEVKTSATTPNSSKSGFGFFGSSGVKSTGSELNVSKTGFGDTRKPVFHSEVKTSATTPKSSKFGFGSSDSSRVTSTGSDLNASNIGFGTPGNNFKSIFSGDSARTALFARRPSDSVSDSSLFSSNASGVKSGTAPNSNNTGFNFVDTQSNYFDIAVKSSCTVPISTNTRCNTFAKIRLCSDEKSVDMKSNQIDNTNLKIDIGSLNLEDTDTKTSDMAFGIFGSNTGPIGSINTGVTGFKFGISGLSNAGSKIANVTPGDTALKNAVGENDSVKAIRLCTDEKSGDIKSNKIDNTELKIGIGSLKLEDTNTKISDMAFGIFGSNTGPIGSINTRVTGFKFGISGLSNAGSKIPNVMPGDTDLKNAMVETDSVKADHEADKSDRKSEVTSKLNGTGFKYANIDTHKVSPGDISLKNKATSEDMALLSKKASPHSGDSSLDCGKDGPKSDDTGLKIDKVETGYQDTNIETAKSSLGSGDIIRDIELDGPKSDDTSLQIDKDGAGSKGTNVESATSGPSSETVSLNIEKDDHKSDDTSLKIDKDGDGCKGTNVKSAKSGSNSGEISPKIEKDGLESGGDEAQAFDSASSFDNDSHDYSMECEI